MLNPISLDSLQVALENINLIEAAAGTGKTYTIQNLVVRLLLEKGCPIEEMVILSFTNKAADELSERILRVLNNALAYLKNESLDSQAAALIQNDRKVRPQVDDQERIRVLKKALRDFDMAQISTINGFFQRILSEFAFESGVLFNVALEQDSRMRLQQLYRNWFRCHFYDHPFQELLIGLLGAEKDLIEKAMRYADENALSFAQPPQKLNVVLGEIEAIFEKLLQVYDHDEIAAIEDMLFTARAKKLEPFLKGVERGILNAGLLKLMENFTPEALDNVIRKEYRENLRQLLAAKPFFQYCTVLVKLAARLKQAVLSDALFELRSSFEAAKRRENFMTYNDQNSRVADALHSPDRVLVDFLRKKFKVGIIDEFQDTNSAQYRIFHALFAPGANEPERCCFLVGDPRQAIYRFRGGDLFVYFKARKQADKIYFLDRNFRSSPLLVEAVNQIFADHPSPFGDDDLSFPRLNSQEPEDCPDMIDTAFSETPPPLRLNMCLNQEVITSKCAARISQMISPSSTERIYDDELKDFRRVRCSDIAVLVRGHDRADEMRRALLALNIPAVCSRTGSIFNTVEAGELYQIFYALRHIDDRGAVNGALLTGICGLKLQEVVDNRRNDETAGTVIDGQHNLLLCARIWQDEGFDAMFETLFKLFDVNSRLGKLPNGERKISNLLQLREHLQLLNTDSGAAPEALLAAFGECIVNSDDRDEEQAEFPASEHPAIRIMTIHASKGLGFPVVMLPDLQGYAWHKSREYVCHNDDSAMVMNVFDDQSFRERCIIEGHQEHLRLLYVAITRAKYRCEIFVDSSNPNLNALDYLLNGDLYNISDTKRAGCFESRVALPRFDLDDLKPEIFCGEEVEDEPQPPPEVATAEPDWRIVSYSFLSRNAQAQGIPVDRDEENERSDSGGKNSKESGFTPFKLPGGNLFGTALHEIFEKISFSASPEEFQSETARVFRSYGISFGGGENHEKLVNECGLWLHNVCHTPLVDADGDTFTLSQIPGSDRKNEMEFYFGLGGFDLQQVKAAVNEYVRSSELRLQAWPENWQAQLAGGILNGFIDLVFRYHGRYYIIDWKSNRLEGNIQNFSPENLKGAMVESFYFFQYLLYIVALVRHLRRFNNNSFGAAEYEQLCGGVYYLFVRGMVPSHPGYGVFRARPDWRVIAALEQVLCG